MSEKKIISYVCNWEGYSGLEVAGLEKRAYPAEIKMVRVPCLGRMHMGLILKTFEMGADGVLMLGCPVDRCHYDSGMKRAKSLVKDTALVLDLLGIDSRRLKIKSIPVADGELVAKEFNSFARRMIRMGANKAAPQKAKTAGRRS
ncbi:hydrogenase iron-sulfur subunit [Chloroflexota bacterium]